MAVVANVRLATRPEGTSASVSASTAESGSLGSGSQPPSAPFRLRPVFGALYASLALLYIRNIYRVVEFADGYNGFIATHEAFHYIFDFAPVFACCCVFTIWHFGFYLPPRARVASLSAEMVPAAPALAPPHKAPLPPSRAGLPPPGTIATVSAGSIGVVPKGGY